MVKLLAIGNFVTAVGLSFAVDGYVNEGAYGHAAGVAVFAICITIINVAWIPRRE